MQNKKMTEWVLRIAVAGSFFGHGMFAIQGKEGWFKYFNAVGINNVETVTLLLLLVGILDLALAVLLLIKPVRIAVLWMALWGLWTALIRWPIGPDPVWDFVERWNNWGAPLALLLILGWPRNWKEWFK
jgi:uncharacterized membrane protein YphA (DoxX/SURF4 family)